MKNIVLCVLLSAVIACPAVAEDVWVLQGFATSPIPGSVFAYIWSSGVMLHNASVNDATIRLIDISNGAPVGTSDRQFVVPSGRSASALPWRGNAGLWVTHIDVPPGVIVESRIRIGDMLLPLGQPVHDADRGKLSFPVYRSLQPAGTPKIHLGTDLEEIPSRNNVAVYNAGDVAAHARIEVHQLCDEALIDSRDLDIPTKTVIQVTGLINATNGCIGGLNYTYVAVTMDQPSLSWVSTLSNADQIKVVYAATSSSP